MVRTPAERHDLLVQAIERDAGVKVELDALGHRTARRVRSHPAGAPSIRPDAIGYYVVSGTQSADDVLAPLLLARWAEAYDRESGEVAVDIAPLFESVDALEHCGDVMRTLLGDPLYRRHLDARGRTQCALIGYSDTNKESGICASRFAAYRAQAELSAALAAANERHVIFHARGGSIARGGGRIDSLVRTAPAGTVNGVLRLTEQGEVINQSYGLRPIAMRTLERAFNALALSIGGAATRRRGELRAGAVRGARRGGQPPALPAPGARRCRFLHLVPGGDSHRRDHAHADRLASRGAARQGRIRRAARRALGVRVDAVAPHAARLVSAPASGCAPPSTNWASRVARSAYAEWNFFTTLIDDLEASLARADLDIAAAYEELAEARLRHFGVKLREEFRVVRRAGAGDQADHRRCSTATRRCSARSSCAIRTSIRSTCCRSIY